MEWICGVSYTTTGFCLRTIDGNQDEHVRPIKELQSVLATNGNLTKIRGNTSFADWRELSTIEIDELAKELGFPTGCNGQTFYEFNVEGQRYIIPAGVLMCAMFRPFHGIAKYLFAPQGLDNLCIPYGNCEKPELMFFVSLRGSTGIQADKAEGILNSFSWMHCFPSAKRMWFSVLELAKLGTLSLALPQGEFSFTGSASEKSHGLQLITELRIRTLTSNEAPLASFNAHTKTIYFERPWKVDSENKRVTAARVATSKIPLRAGELRLSDDEWEHIQPLVNHSWRFRKYDIRTYIDMYLERLAFGTAWEELCTTTKLVSAARRSISNMKRDGRWAALMKLLSELRQTK